MHFFNIGMKLVRGPLVIGYEDDPENFFLKCQTTGNDPQIFCRVLGPNGRLLFSINANKLSYNPGNKFRMESDKDVHTGIEKWIIIDSMGRTILKIETRNEVSGVRTTYIQGYFFDKNCKVAAKGDERTLNVDCPVKM